MKRLFCLALIVFASSAYAQQYITIASANRHPPYEFQITVPCGCTVSRPHVINQGNNLLFGYKNKQVLYINVGGRISPNYHRLRTWIDDTTLSDGSLSVVADTLIDSGDTVIKYEWRGIDKRGRYWRDVRLTLPRYARKKLPCIVKIGYFNIKKQNVVEFDKAIDGVREKSLSYMTQEEVRKYFDEHGSYWIIEGGESCLSRRHNCEEEYFRNIFQK